MKHFFAVLVFLSVSAMAGDGACLASKALPDLPDSIGVAGPFVGVHNDALIVAGGADFPVPAGGDLWEVPKVYHDKAWVLVRKGESYEWKTDFTLEKPVGYGMCVSTENGVVCIGGQTGKVVYSDVFRLEWDAKTETLKQTKLPPLTEACTGGAAALMGNVVYVAGGQSGAELNTATKNFWRLDLGAEKMEWEKLPPWPGPERAFNQMVAQHNGREMCLYVFGGRRQDAKVEGIAGIIAMNDVYEFSPSRKKSGKAEAWRKRKASPKPMMAGTAVAVGQSHIFVVGGADGEGLKKIAADADFVKTHPGFPKRAWAYHTITDTWIDAGPLPANHVTTPAVKWGDDIIIASGEIKPRVRSVKVWRLTPVENKKPFGAINFTVLALYLLVMVGVGVWFMRKNKTTDDYFRGGQNIPWWAAACSIYATMLSSLTFVALPALVYATDWLLYIGMLMIPAVAPLAIYGAMPFFRRIDATSAYEYLGKRFSRPVRLIGSGLFTLFHISRMGIVMALTALALSAVTPLSPWQSVLIMGVLCLIYCTMGGVEAVIWTDTIQTVVLLGGAVVCVFYIIGGVDGGFGGVLDLAKANDKMTLVNLDFSPDSFTVLALWVIILGGFGQNLSSYTSDQAVVQRYMTTKSTAAAARSIWANGILAVFGSLLFFFIGTGLYAFYHSNPAQLNPTIQNDQIFPMFIATELPVGIAGLIVAGIFAAAQSTVSTSMNSTATTLVTDFLRPFNRCDSEAGYLKAAKVLTLVMGVLGTMAGLLFISPEIRSLMSEYFKVIGMFMGALGGLFLLGILTTRAHARGAFIGLLGGVAVMIWIWRATETNGFLYSLIGIVSCLFIGYVASVLLPTTQTNLENLTLHTLIKKESANG
ncbi:MAG: sodium/solute symporter [Verrucomicrobia subdivision 3 bacterium]|nr:sodium/solute symporter [Limisphaerales bacterium]